MSKMRAAEFVRRCVSAAEKYDTLYVMGCFGAPLQGRSVHRYCNNHPYNRQPARTRKIQQAADKNPPVYGFDCVCFVKGILWGWVGDAGHVYGGAQYLSNRVPDVNADGMIGLCSDVSSRFDRLEAGELVWLPGHVGVYIGDGKVVECTPMWQDGVQITKLSQRDWAKHGKLQAVDYGTDIKVCSIPAARFTVEVLDSQKRSGEGQYCNAGYFGIYQEDGTRFTLPVGHLRGYVHMLDTRTYKYLKERGKVEGDVVTYDCGSWAYDNRLYGKAVTTLIVKDGQAAVAELVHLPACDFAISGLPIKRTGKPVSYGTIMAQGWDGSPLRPTKHILACLRDSSHVDMVAIKTEYGGADMVAEICDRLPQYRDIIKLDGGGSYHWALTEPEDTTPEDRRICTIIKVEQVPDILPWYNSYMERVKAMGIMDGTRPEDTATRAELAAALCNMIDYIKGGETE